MRRQWLFIVWPVILAVVAGVGAYFAASAQTSRKLNAVDTNVALWQVQPGLGTVMIEYATRFDNVWWAADGGNWDMVNYQLKEMTEIQEVGETTRPARADALKKFETEYLEKLIEAAKAKDKTAFVAAYDLTITGCNKCHGEQKDSAGNDFRWIKIIRPTNPPPLSDVEWKAQP
jgi:hypothetical protein